MHHYSLQKYMTDTLNKTRLIKLITNKSDYAIEEFFNVMISEFIELKAVASATTRVIDYIDTVQFVSCRTLNDRERMDILIFSTFFPKRMNIFILFVTFAAN